MVYKYIITPFITGFGAHLVVGGFKHFGGINLPLGGKMIHQLVNMCNKFLWISLHVGSNAKKVWQYARFLYEG